MASNEVKIVVKSTDQTGPAFDSAEKRGKTMGDRMRGIGAAAGSALALGFGVAAIGFMKGAIDEAREAEKVMRSTAQGIKTMGAESWTSADAIGDLAQSISNKIGVDDELIQQSANLLLTFGNVRNAVGENNNIFDRATMAAQDLAAKGFGDADSAAKMLGKALNDPIKGMTALGKAGVTFSEAQKEQIKAMVKSGDILGAQKMIMAEVEKQVGGTAAATATAADKMRVAWGNLQENVGTALLPMIESMAEAAGAAAKWASENPELVSTILKVAGGAVALSVAVKLLNLGKEVFGWGRAIGQGIGLIGSSADDAAGKVGAGGKLQGALKGLAALAAGVVVVKVMAELTPGDENTKTSDDLNGWVQEQANDLGAAADMIFSGKFKEIGQQLSGEWDMLWAKVFDDQGLAGPIAAIASQLNSLSVGTTINIGVQSEQTMGILRELGFTVEMLPDGTVNVTATDDQARERLRAFLDDTGNSSANVTIGGLPELAYGALNTALGAVQGSFAQFGIGAYDAGATATARQIRANIDSMTATISVFARQLGGVFGYAHGGIYGGGHAAQGGGRSGLVLVGERGPELVNMPGGSMVTPAGQTRNMLQEAAQGGGGAVVVEFRGDLDGAMATAIMKLYRTGQIQVSAAPPTA